MKTSNLTKKFYKAFENYYNAAYILEDYSQNPYIADIIYPAIYLLRHSAELLIKSLICEYVPEQKIVIKNKKIQLSIINKKFHIEGHSLVELYNLLLEVASSSLIAFIKKDDEIFTKIMKIEKIDKNTEYYRYPISAKTSSSRVESLQLQEMKYAPDLSRQERFRILVKDDMILTAKNYDNEVRENLSIILDIINELLKYSSVYSPKSGKDSNIKQ